MGYIYGPKHGSGRSNDPIFERTTKQRIKDIPNKYNAFNQLFIFAMIIALPLTPSSISLKQRKTSTLVKRVCYVVIFLRTIFLTLACVYSNVLLPSVAARITYYAYAGFGYINALYLIIKTEKLLAIIKQIHYLTVHLGHNTDFGKSAIKRRVFAGAVATLVVVGIHIQFFMIQEWDAAMVVIISPFSPDSSSHYCFVWLIEFSVVFSFSISAATTYTILLLCDNVYYSMGRLFYLCGKKLAKDLENDCSCDTISKNLDIFKKIAAVIRQADGVLNINAFLIYAVVISMFFNTASVLLSTSNKFRTTLGDSYVGWTFLCNVVAFLILTDSGATVVDKNNELKNKLLAISNTVIQNAPDALTFLNFDVLYENIKATKIFMTGMGLFKITRAFTLSVGGTIITYGVLIYQMGATD